MNTKDRILAETPVSVKEKVRETANDLVGKKEIMYSEEEVKEILTKCTWIFKESKLKWFEEFKKK